jgi:hypothetical protein
MFLRPYSGLRLTQAWYIQLSVKDELLTLCTLDSLIKENECDVMS